MSEKSLSNNFVRVAISSKMELPQLPLIQTNMFNAIIFRLVYRIWKKEKPTLEIIKSIFKDNHESDVKKNSSNVLAPESIAR